MGKIGINKQGKYHKSNKEDKFIDIYWNFYNEVDDL